jgi:general secretion pathway protein K
MSARQQIDIRRTENILQRDQAQLYLLGAESWALGVLERDAERNEVDAIGDIWATSLPPMPVEGGAVSGKIVDQQGLFNINNLLAEEGVSEPDLERFQRLLGILRLEEGIAQAVLDWLDEDLDARPPEGAEDDTYVGADPPYRAANAPLVSITELRLVSGIGDEDYQRLRPFVTALPERTSINVNTAPLEVLRCIADVIDAVGAESLLDLRGEEGFETVEEFLQSPALAGAESDVTDEGLSISSKFFRAEGEAQIGRVQARLRSLLKREGAVLVVARSRGDL